MSKQFMRSKQYSKSPKFKIHSKQSNINYKNDLNVNNNNRQSYSINDYKYDRDDYVNKDNDYFNKDNKYVNKDKKYVNKDNRKDS